MAERSWDGEAWSGGFGRRSREHREWGGPLGDERLPGEWDEEEELAGDDVIGYDFAGLEMLDDLSGDDLLSDLLGTPSQEVSWSCMEPVNVDEKGRIFRKTRFPVLFGGPAEAEWMWVQVQSLEDRSGILSNQPLFVPGLSVGDVVQFEIIPEGRPLAGCAEAVGW